MNITPIPDDAIVTIKVREKFAHNIGILACFRQVTIAEAAELLMRPMRELEAAEFEKRRERDERKGGV